MKTLNDVHSWITFLDYVSSLTKDDFKEFNDWYDKYILGMKKK